MADKRKFRIALQDAVDNAAIQIRGGIIDPAIRDQIYALCEKHGYGNVICSASALWRERDNWGAFAYGPCIGTILRFMELAEDAEVKPNA